MQDLIGKKARAYIAIEEYNGRKYNKVKYYIDDGNGLPSPLGELLLASWGSWLSENPCPPNVKGAPTINLWIPKTVSACLFRKLPPTWAADLIRRAMTRRGKGSREVERTVERIYGGKVSGTSSRVELVEPYNPERLAHIASHVPFEVTNDWLAEQSPECVLDVSPGRFLDALFTPEERVAVMMEKRDRGFIYRPGVARDAERLHNYVRLGSEGAWYLSNPVTGPRSTVPIDPRLTLPDSAIREDRKEREAGRKRELLLGPKEKRVVLWDDIEWIPAGGFVRFSQSEQVKTGAIYAHEKGSYWITSLEDSWIKATETAVKNHLHIDKGIPKVVPKDPETGEKLGPNPMDEAMNTVVRVANVELVTQMAGYSKGIYNCGGRSWRTSEYLTRAK